MSERDREFKDAIYREFARVGGALSSPRRLELLDLLSQGARNVEELARASNMTVANTSQHLKVLRNAHLVEAEKNGLHVNYRLADEGVCELVFSLYSLAERRIAQVEILKRTFLGGEGELEGLDRESLLQRVRRGEVEVLDVRPVEEYQAGHIPGAVSIPLKELEKQLSELPRDKEIIAYCRGPYCLLATEAVRILRKHSFKACRLSEGVVEWKAMGHAISTGNN